ncbi:MAG: tetratricopeptide repeat protein, partial [Verrucomicrobiota bacterium]
EYIPQIPETGLSRSWALAALTHVSKVANDFGVYLADQGKAEPAIEAYHDALKLDPANLSAIINRAHLAEQTEAPRAREYAWALERYVKNEERRYNIFSVARIYGQVRTPEAHLDMGLREVATERNEAAIQSMKRALQLGAPETPTLLALAALLNQREDPSASERHYEEVLSIKPGNWQAQLGLARIAMQRQQFSEARRLLNRSEFLHAPPLLVEQERAILLLMEGRGEKALQSIRAFIRQYPHKKQAWLILAAIGSLMDDENILRESIHELAKFGPEKIPMLELILARDALVRGKVEEARASLKTAIARNRAFVPAMELLLRLEMEAGNYDEAAIQIKNLLSLHPGHALANHMMGTFYILRKEFDLAETFILVSLKTHRRPDALNDLAYAIFKQERFEEALEMLAEALEREPGRGAFWDTRGSILYKMSRLDEARVAFEKAVDYLPGHPISQYHLAQTYEKLGFPEKAKPLFDAVAERKLPPHLFEDL